MCRNLLRRLAPPLRIVVLILGFAIVYLNADGCLAECLDLGKAVEEGKAAEEGKGINDFLNALLNTLLNTDMIASDFLVNNGLAIFELVHIKWRS